MSLPIKTTRVTIKDGDRMYHYTTYLDAEVIETHLLELEMLACNNEAVQTVLEFRLESKGSVLSCQTSKVKMQQIVEKMEKFDAYTTKTFGQGWTKMVKRINTYKEKSSVGKVVKVVKSSKAKSKQEQMLEKINKFVKGVNLTGSRKCPFMIDFEEYDLQWKEDDMDVALAIYEMQDNGVNVGSYHLQSLAWNPGPWTHFSWDGKTTMPNMKAFYLKMYDEYQKGTLSSFQHDAHLH